MTTAPGGPSNAFDGFDYAPPPPPPPSTAANSNQFFTANHALAGAGQQHQSPYNWSPSSSERPGQSHSRTASYSAMPDFKPDISLVDDMELDQLDDDGDDVDDGRSEAASTTAGRSSGTGAVGRPRKRIKSTAHDDDGGGNSVGGNGTGHGHAESGEDADATTRPGPSRKTKSSGSGASPAPPGSKVAGGSSKAKGKKKDDGSAEGKTVKPRAKKAQGEKKKKAGRACAACQKAHLTCDDARPCARCVKKGIADSCHDGTRKKAKYLMEVPDELLELGRNTSQPPADNHPQPDHLDSTSAAVDSGAETASPGTALVDPAPPAFSFDTPLFYDSTFNTEFGSEAANLEYAILSSMLNGNGFTLDNNNYGAGTSAAGAMANVNNGMASSDPRLSGGANGSTMLVNSPLGHSLNLGVAPTPMRGSSTSGYLDGASAATSNLSPSAGPAMQSQSGMYQGSTAAGSSAAQDANYGLGTERYDSAGQSQQQTPASRTGVMTAEEAYRSVTRPYPYAQSYHYLIKHLKSRFEKNDILRIIRALATFRPSLIALQMPLTEEDEIFVERTFQRTLVELNKLIGFSGTPTVVWRRTGEVCLVGTEFCLLTGWSRDELVNKKYIFELLDTASVVDLYEAFAKHAFESTSSSVTMQCVVLGPTGRPVPCAFCFSIRRDLFSCPSLVVGSFLPILT